MIDNYPFSIRIITILASVAYLWSIVAALRGSQISVRQSLLWLASSLFLLGASIYPNPILYIANRLGFIAPSNAVIIAWLLLVTIMLFYQSLTTSKQSAQLKSLAQELAILRAEHQQMEP